MNFREPLTHSGAGCASALRAIAEESRLALLRLLGGGERSVSELSEALGAQVHFVSRHLAVLRAAGLVTGRREGQRVLYRLAPSVGGMGPDRLELGCCQLRFPGGDAERDRSCT